MNEKEKNSYIKGMQDLADRLSVYFERLGNNAYGPLVAYHINQVLEDIKRILKGE